RVRHLSVLAQGARHKLECSASRERRLYRSCRVLARILRYRQWLDSTVSRWRGLATLVVAGIADAILLAHWTSITLPGTVVLSTVVAIIAGGFATLVTLYPSDSRLHERLRESAAARSSLRNSIAHDTMLWKSQERELA